MFCSHCGTQLSENARFCKKCGMAQAPVADPRPAASRELVGFSQRIQDPAFDAFRKKEKAGSLLFAGILFVVAGTGFPLYGKISGEVAWPLSLIYGLGIGGMFVVIALMQTARRGRDSTWDGTVVDKKAVKKQRNDSADHGISYYSQYIVTIRKDNGQTRKHRINDQPGLFNYLRIGERVRHHKGFQVYEKYDKSHDAEIMCIA